VLATANQNVLPPGYEEPLGYEWSPDFRKRRIDEVLAARERWDVAGFQALQHDEQSVVARRLMALVQPRLAGQAGDADDERAMAGRVFDGWDGTMAQDSAAAALYQLWLVELQTALRPHAFSEQTLPHAPETLTVPQVLHALDRSEEARGLIDGEPLVRAVRAAREELGDDPAAWRWGRLHRAHFRHMFSARAGVGEAFDLRPVPRGGDATTPNNTGHGRFQVHGASFRIVLDTADWDRSVMINVPGQSGQPGSPHYGDLLPLWAAGEYHPMPFSREAVERHAAHRLWLRPR
jgi:penicillin G amidase